MTGSLWHTFTCVSSLCLTQTTCPCFYNLPAHVQTETHVVGKLVSLDSCEIIQKPVFIMDDKIHANSLIRLSQNAVRQGYKSS